MTPQTRDKQITSCITTPSSPRREACPEPCRRGRGEGFQKNANPYRPHAIILILTLLVSGCTVGPDYKPPIVPVPKQWSEAPKDTHKPVLSKDKGDCPKRHSGSMVEIFQRPGTQPAYQRRHRCQPGFKASVSQS